MAGDKITWQTQFDSEVDNVHITGYVVASEDECRNYFNTRVAAKLCAGDGAEELKVHLIEMESTGFDVQGLRSQIEESPKVKDWEIGEAFAEITLEDEHDAMFPWQTGFDKRAPKASLPGPDLVGFQNRSEPQFLFGEIKSSSEDRVPPQVVNATDDCLCNQLFKLRHTPLNRQQLISWLLVRVQNTEWINAFNQALERYAYNNFLLVGVLVSGKREANEKDFTGICARIANTPVLGKIHLKGFYLPFHKDDWFDIINARDVAS